MTAGERPDEAVTEQPPTAAADSEAAEAGAPSDDVPAEGELVDDVDVDAAFAEQLLEVDIEKLLAEREEYLDALRRLQADFENFKKRMIKQQTDHVERAAGALVEKLLPALDAFDLAMAHGSEGLEPVYRTLLGVLEAEGLSRVDPVGQPFDPNEHDAVAHEEGDTEHPEVIEVMRAGYRWKGRVLRPAMVKVKG
jgi:molecular chaperone GrpE